MQSLTKTLLSGAAAVMIAGTVFAPSANATCWWAGGDWNCTSPAPAGAVIAPGGVPHGSFYIPAPSWGFDANRYSYPGVR